jgi:predicted PurR-regulated permease PerM
MKFVPFYLVLLFTKKFKKKLDFSCNKNMSTILLILCILIVIVLAGLVLILTYLFINSTKNKNTIITSSSKTIPYTSTPYPKST